MKRFLSRAFLIFCVIGVINTLVHLTVFNLLVEVDTLLANTVAFIAASVFSYCANSTFTYQTPMKSRTFIASMFAFLLKLLISNVLTLGFERLLISLDKQDLIKFIPIPVTMIILPLQFIVFNWIFRKKKT